MWADPLADRSLVASVDQRGWQAMNPIYITLYVVVVTLVITLVIARREGEPPASRRTLLAAAGLAGLGVLALVLVVLRG